MSKSRRASSLPVRVVPGIGCTDQEEARNERETLVEGRVRCCGAPYMGGAQSRQPGILQLCCIRFSARSNAEAPVRKL